MLVMGGYSIAHAMMMMIPEAWRKTTSWTRAGARSTSTRRDAGALGRPGRHRLYRRRQIGATLDRNGLRPRATS